MNEKLGKDVNKRIKTLREDILNLTQKEFAEKLEISRDKVAAIELGRNVVQIEFISHVCNKFQIERIWLEKGEGEIRVTNQNALVGKLLAEITRDNDAKTVEFFTKFLSIEESKKELFYLMMKEFDKQ